MTLDTLSIFLYSWIFKINSKFYLFQKKKQLDLISNSSGTSIFDTFLVCVWDYWLLLSVDEKLFFPGAGESGKSTIFKQVGWFFVIAVISWITSNLPWNTISLRMLQIRLLFQTGFDEKELRSYSSVIHANIFQTIKVCNSEKGVFVVSL